MSDDESVQCEGGPSLVGLSGTESVQCGMGIINLSAFSVTIYRIPGESNNLSSILSLLSLKRLAIMPFTFLLLNSTLLPSCHSPLSVLGVKYCLVYPVLLFHETILFTSLLPLFKRILPSHPSLSDCTGRATMFRLSSPSKSLNHLILIPFTLP